MNEPCCLDDVLPMSAVLLDREYVVVGCSYRVKFSMRFGPVAIDIFRDGLAQMGAQKELGEHLKTHGTGGNICKCAADFLRAFEAKQEAAALAGKARR